MAEARTIKILYDKTGNTLSVWFGDPKDEYVCTETTEEIILIKDKTGYVIGFEKLNAFLPAGQDVRLVFETAELPV
jgi:hypothetical protein